MATGRFSETGRAQRKKAPDRGGDSLRAGQRRETFGSHSLEGGHPRGGTRVQWEVGTATVPQEGLPSRAQVETPRKSK